MYAVSVSEIRTDGRTTESAAAFNFRFSKGTFTAGGNPNPTVVHTGRSSRLDRLRHHPPASGHGYRA